jgi:hypothetical protein
MGELEVAVRVSQWLTVAVAAVLSLDCSGSSNSPKIRTRDAGSFTLPVWTSDGMYLVTGRSGALFLTPPPLDLNQYRGVVVDEIQISTRDRSRKLTSFEDERLKGYFTRRLKTAFESNGWPMVDTPGEDVLRVRLIVRNLKLERWRRNHFGNVIMNSSLDRIVIVLELRDAVGNDRRLLFGDRRRLPFGVYSGSSAISILRVEDAFFDFSIDFRRRLREVQHGEFPPPPRPS